MLWVQPALIFLVLHWRGEKTRVGGGEEERGKGGGERGEEGRGEKRREVAGVECNYGAVFYLTIVIIAIL